MENKKINERIKKLRVLMNQKKLDAYIIPTNDFHGSEYVGDYFKTREYMSGFSGSAGTLIITSDEAGLWTDGRYFLQAEDELNGTCITLYKMGVKGDLTMFEFLEKLSNNSNIGFDGRVLSTNYVLSLIKKLNHKHFNYLPEFDLVDEIWDERPNLSKELCYLVDSSIAGETRKSKIERVREHLNKVNADNLLLTSLDDICWLLNIRGNDVECNPVVLSYLLINKDNVKLYIDENKLNNISQDLINDGIKILSYFEVYNDVKKIEKETVLIDYNKVNYCLYASLNNAIVINQMNITTEFKTIKNNIEINNIKNAHLKDGVALTKFIYWIKHHIADTKMTEISASDQLYEFRKEGKGFLGLSFPTIAGFKNHGAIVHYEATNDTNSILTNESFLLVDSGGQYIDGTTDVTRTISLGKLTKEEISSYTTVLKGHLALSNAVFLEGTTGVQLDMLAREPLWKKGLNFNHGTGHGVGNLLNVHEGPQSISNVVARCSYPFKEGMVTSNEPGLYVSGKFGVRIENLVSCKLYKETEYGRFLCFEDLTLAPYDIEAINVNELSVEEKEQIHEYHLTVYNMLKDFLTKEESIWLEEIVKAI